MGEYDSEIKVEDYILSREESKKSKEPNKGSNWVIYLFPLLLVGVAVIFYNIGASKFQSEEVEDRKEQLSRLNEIIQIVEENYVDSVSADELYKSSINGMLDELDPHSAFIPKEDVEASNEQLQGHFGGVGIRFIILRDTLMVTNVIKNGPSEKAGVKAGDRIIKVDGENLAGVGIDIPKVHDKLKGEHSTPVVLTVLRKGKERDIDILRGDIPLPSVDAVYKLTEDIGVIRITSFSGYTDVEFDDAITMLKKQGVKKMIMDLRHNGGGYMHTAINVADEFLKDGELVVYTQGVNSPKQETFATKFGQCENMPLAILVNSGSASASEIVSGALQDNDRAIIIGRRSFGKGLVQKPMELPDGSELRLTVSRYYTPTGRSIQKPYGNGIDYESDIYDRYENGELQEIDSSIFENAPKFTTPLGKTVYGGGGIMPDVFVPIDTTGSSYYFTSLTYSEAFRNFSFDYLDKYKSEFNYADDVEFNKKFTISDKMLRSFVEYAEQNQEIEIDENELSASKARIKSYLKGEIGTYLYETHTRFLVNVPYDRMIQVAIEELQKK